MAEPLNVFSIPAGAPFLSVLADAILVAASVRSPTSDDPLALADVTILLPTRRAVRAFRETLIDKLGGEAAILPVDPADRRRRRGGSPPRRGVEAGADRLVLPPAISTPGAPARARRADARLGTRRPPRPARARRRTSRCSSPPPPPTPSGSPAISPV